VNEEQESETLVFNISLAGGFRKITGRMVFNENSDAEATFWEPVASSVCGVTILDD
jgi:hypothetical protein